MSYIFGFMHSAMMGHWKEVNSEMLYTMEDSKLLYEAISLNIGVVGYEEKQFQLPFSINTTINVEHFGSLREYEYVTLESLRIACIEMYTDQLWKYKIGIDEDEPIYVFYCCNAGVSHEKDRGDGYPDWRWLTSYFTHTRWRDCVAILDQGYDTVGVEWQTDPVPHWSGNFWWANAEYIATLPLLDDMKKFNAGKGISAKTHPRHGAEFWIGMNKDVKYKSLFQTGYNWRDRPRKKWCETL